LTALTVQAYVARETMSGDNAWNCENCSRRRTSTKSLQITRLPPILIVHLARVQRGMDYETKDEVCPATRRQL